jgi:DNA-binding IscR family transcriptional regulator
MIHVTERLLQSIRIVEFLRKKPGTVFTVDRIAVEIEAPPAAVSKTLQTLVRARILSSHRGSRGGFKMVDSREVPLLAIYEVVEGVIPAKIGHPALNEINKLVKSKLATTKL